MQNKVTVSKGWQLELLFCVDRTQPLDCSVGDVDLIVKEVKSLWCWPRGLLVVLTTATWVPAFTLLLLSSNTRQNADKLVPFSNDAAAVTDHYSTQPVLPLPSNCRASSVSCCCGFQNVHQNGGYGCWYLTPRSYQEERRVNKIKSECPIHCLVFTSLFFFCVPALFCLWWSVSWCGWRLWSSEGPPCCCLTAGLTALLHWAPAAFLLLREGAEL